MSDRFDYAGLAVEVKALIAEFGFTATLNGSPEDVSSPETPWAPVAGTSTEDTVTACWDQWTASEAGSVQAGDRKVYVASYGVRAGSRILLNPTVGDTLDTGEGRAYDVVGIERIGGGNGPPGVFVLQVRR